MTGTNLGETQKLPDFLESEEGDNLFHKNRLFDGIKGKLAEEQKMDSKPEEEQD